jgi:hypothetical protein
LGNGGLLTAPTGNKPEQPDKKRWKLRLTRDAIIFYTGWIGILHQTLIADSDRNSLLILFGAMIGLPAAFRLDEWRKDKDK